MFSFFQNIFGNKSYLGIDIGTTSIKMVELAKRGNSTQLINYGILESSSVAGRQNSVIQANSLKISEKETVALLKILLQKSKFGTNLAVASIPSFSSFITFLEVPSMSEEETNKTMSFQIKQNIPLPLSDIAVDWIRVGERTDENGFTKQQILLIAIANETISKYKSIFKQAGLVLKAIEVENLSYARSIIGSDQTPTIIVDIGARSTNISIVDQGFVKHNTQVDYAGDSLTFAVMKGLGIGYQRAEELKKANGIQGGVGDYELSTLEIPFVDVIINEVMKVATASGANLARKIQRIILIGGGANLLGIEKYFEQQLGITTVLGDGLLYINFPPELDLVAKELRTRFAIATGLALKGLI